MNCIIIEDDAVSRKIEEEFISRTNIFDYVASYENPIEAIKELRSKKFDLMLIDVELPFMTGLELINSLESPPQIIIVSAKDKYALKAFEYDVADYLFKPISYSRFLKAVMRALSRINKDKVIETETDVFIRQNNNLVRVKNNDIIWIEAMENYVVFVTFYDKYTVHCTMKIIEEKFSHTKFLRIHRSFIINIDKIKSISDNSVAVDISEGQKQLPVGKSYRSNLLGKINLITK